MINDDGQGALKWAISFNPPVNESEHIKDIDGLGKMITTSGGVLLGKVSFQMNADEFNIESFKLVESEKSPKTGIKINIDNIRSYQNQSTFRFTDKTASKDADLTSIQVSSGIKNDDNPDESTYKEYKLTPEFNKEIKEYQITLLEYLDTIDITATQSDSKSKMKIKYPKRDVDGNLIYEADGTTIVYDETDLANQTAKEVTLNKLGEADTEITIKVMAEDGKTTNEYEVVIKRPYATLIGQDILANFDNQNVVDNILDIYGTKVNHRATINLYKTDLARWEELPDIYQQIYENPMTYEDIEQIPKEMSAKTNLDGTFKIYIIPGKYDIQVMRLAYLDYIYSDVEVNTGDVINMGTFRLEAGDANRDGIVTQEDINEVSKNLDKKVTSENNLEVCNSSQIGIIVAEDLDYVNRSQDRKLQIVYFSK